jgi:glycosyltransferase involved in cell wall biosynthesis
VDHLLSEPAAASRDPKERLRILSLSRLEEWKGVHILLEALTLLPAHELAKMDVTVAGSAHFSDERYESSLKTMALEHRLPVRFIGHVDDVASLLRESHVLVHCALRPEPFGQVIVQGLAAGLITIASDAGGPREIIDPGRTGMLVPPGDSRALSSALSWSLEETSGPSAFTQRARNAAATFSDAHTRAALDRALSSIIKRLVH